MPLNHAMGIFISGGTEFMKKNYGTTMKRTIAVLMLVLMALTAAPASGFAGLFKAQAASVLTPEEAVDIYLNNKSVWMQEDGSFYSYQYFFLDFDFDGVLELAYNSMSGTGYFSENGYFRIDPKTKKVYRLSETQNGKSCTDYGEGIDYDSTLKLYKDKKTGAYFYFGDDFWRDGMFANGRESIRLGYSGGALKAKSLFGVKRELKSGTTDQYVSTYYDYTSGKSVKLSKSNYDKKRSSYFASATNLHLKYKFANDYGDLLSSKSASTQRSMLLASYKAFSYDGYLPGITYSLSATSYIYDGKVKTPKVTVKNSKGKDLVKGTDYTVKYASGRKNPGKYAVVITFKGKYSGTRTLYFKILPGKTSKLTATQSSSSIKASWKAVTGASGYKVTLYSSKNKAIQSVYTTKTAVSFSGLASGTTYKVRVTAYKTMDGKKVCSSVYTTISTATKPGAPMLKASAGSGQAELKWNKQTGASGYVVYMSSDKNGTYEKIAVLKGSSKLSYTKTELASGSSLYFKVRAYKTVDGKTLYGGFSAPQAVNVK